MKALGDLTEKLTVGRAAKATSIGENEGQASTPFSLSSQVRAKGNYPNRWHREMSTDNLTGN